MKKQQESVDEKALGKVVAAKLREQLRGVSVGCPDTETLAAFYDRALTDRERAVWEEHLLTCLHCQGYLAELARLSDVDEPSAMLEVEPSATEETKPSWTFRLGWVAPFLIVAIGSALWFRDDIGIFIQRYRSPEIAMNEPEPVAVPEGPAAAGERDREAKQEADKAPAERGRLAKTTLPPVPSAQRTTDDLRAQPPATPATGGAEEAEIPAGAMVPLSKRAELRGPAKPAELVLEYATGERKAAVADRAAPRPSAASAMTAQHSEAVAGFAGRESSELTGVTIQGATPQFTPQWRVGRGGTIQKADGAGGWVNVPSGVQSDLFDITFSGTAGWAVGYQGTVLRSTDGGATWRKVSAPTEEDLVRVSAQSSQRAQVISRGGKSFSTTDGGRSWEAAAQQ